jgi:DNA-directed RNA polymerase subunit RPC12/RpoP
MSKKQALIMVKEHNPAKIDSDTKYKCHQCGRWFKESEGYWCAVGDYNHVEFQCDYDYYESKEAWLMSENE